MCLNPERFAKRLKTQRRAIFLSVNLYNLEPNLVFFQVLLRGFPLPADRLELGLFDGSGYVCPLWGGQSPGQRLRPDQRPGAASALTGV